MPHVVTPAATLMARHKNTHGDAQGYTYDYAPWLYAKATPTNYFYGGLYTQKVSLSLPKSSGSSFISPWKALPIFLVRIFSSLTISIVCGNRTKCQFIHVSQKLFSWLTKPCCSDDYLYGYVNEMPTVMSRLHPMWLR